MSKEVLCNEDIGVVAMELRSVCIYNEPKNKRSTFTLLLVLQKQPGAFQVMV